MYKIFRAQAQAQSTAISKVHEQSYRLEATALQSTRTCIITNQLTTEPQEQIEILK